MPQIREYICNGRFIVEVRISSLEAVRLNGSPQWKWSEAAVSAGATMTSTEDPITGETILIIAAREPFVAFLPAAAANGEERP
jgi:hypothetical protein